MKKRNLKARIKELEHKLERSESLSDDRFKELVELINNPDSVDSTRIRNSVIFEYEFNKSFMELALFGTSNITQLI